MPFFRRKPFIIQARRVKPGEEPVTVQAFGRTAMAKPGDWILGDMETGQSVASDILFRELYEPVDDEAKKELED